MPRFVKIYGERNSGTTYLTELIEINFTVDLLRGTKRIPDALIHREIMMLAEPARTFRREAIIDADIEATLSQNFGWKHSAPPIEVIRRESVRASQTLFVIVTRHPYSWFDSMYRKPYHDLLPRSPAMAAFLRREWRPVARDNLGDQILKSPIELWNRKMTAYFALDRLRLDVLYLRHEEFLEDFDAAMQKLAARLPKKNGGPWLQVARGMKASDGYEVQAKRAKASLPGSGMTPYDLAFINQNIDRDLVKRLGYELRDKP